MQVATSLRLAFLLLIAAFVVLVGFAAASLAMAGQPAMAMVAVLAGIAGVAAGVTTWLLVRRDEDEPAIAEPEPVAPPVVPLAQPQVLAPRRPLRVQAMPVASLPPEYVAAVTRGMRARTSALRAQTREMHH
ncbi:hypothetical protein [Ramlibacter montanisoli]|uniref:Uncharacterized protein n=1 Tax=Ramlibacter montanisoli TaxID=2732512 RepID=A0A849KEA6_9BURK|nr:hypothetical protein [Ramlibacter montanisoli]NNU43806.1 hypothetical protein [Ramlibacter montanisoli]